MDAQFVKVEAIVKNYFTIYEVEHFTGFSKWMLDYLARENIFAPSLERKKKRGISRRYSYADVVFLRALSSICQGKGKIRHLRQSLTQLRDEVGPLSPGARIDRFLFVEGSELCIRTSGDGAMVLRTGQMLLASVVDLHDVTSNIRGGIVLEGAGKFRLTDVAHDESERLRREYWQQAQEARQRRLRRERSLTKARR